MNGIKTRNYQLCNEINKQICNDKTFKSVKFEVNSSHHSAFYDLSFQGFFLDLSQKDIICYSIFLPNYLILTDSLQHEKILFQLYSDQSLVYCLIFKTKEDSMNFYSIILSILENLQSIIPYINLHICSFNENLIALMPNTDQIVNANVLVGIEKNGNRIQAILRVTPIVDKFKKTKKIKKDKSKKKEKIFCFELNNLGDSINISQPSEVPKSFGEDTFRKVTTEIYTNPQEKCLILCKTVEESYNLILSIYFLSHSRQDFQSSHFLHGAKYSSVFLMQAKNLRSAFKSIDQEGKPKKAIFASTTENPQARTPTVTNKINASSVTAPGEVAQITIPLAPTSLTSEETDASSLDGKFDDFIIEFEEMIEEKSNKTKELNKLIEDQQTSMRRRKTVIRAHSLNRPRRRSTVVKRGNISSTIIKNKSPLAPKGSESNHSDEHESNKEWKKEIESIKQEILQIENERKSLKKNEEIEYSLPDFKSFTKELDLLYVKSTFDSSLSLNSQLEESFRLLEQNSYGGQFSSIKQSEKEFDKTDEIIQKSIDFINDFSIQNDSQSYSNDNHFFDFFEFKGFPSFNPDLLKNSTEPHMEFADKLINTVQSIEMGKIRKVYSETEGQKNEQVGQKLTALVSSIFLNGFRGFKKINEVITRDSELYQNFLTAIRVLSSTFSDMKIIEKAIVKIIQNGETSNCQIDIGILVSAISILVLNNGLLIQALKTIQKNEDWIKRFYLPTSIMASPHLVNLCIVVLTPVFYNTQFLLSIQRSLSCLSNKSSKFIDKIIMTPARGYLEVDPFILLTTCNDNNNPQKILPSSRMKLKSPFCINFDVRSSFQKAIVHQFSFCFKKAFLKISDFQRQFSFINDVSSLSPSFSDNENRRSWKEFVETTKFLKSTNQMMIKEMSSAIEEWVSIGLDKKMLHFWIIFLGINRDIVSKYYYRDSTFSDPYRLNFVVKAIVKFYKLME